MLNSPNPLVDQHPVATDEFSHDLGQTWVACCFVVFGSETDLISLLIILLFFLFTIFFFLLRRGPSSRKSLIEVTHDQETCTRNLHRIELRFLFGASFWCKFLIIQQVYHLYKAPSFQIGSGMKFGRAVLKVNTHRLRESRDFRFDATLSRWRPSWRHFTRNNAATWLVHTQRQPGTYAAASASYWSIVHSYVFYG